MPGTKNVWKNEKKWWFSLWLQLQWRKRWRKQGKEEAGIIIENDQSKPFSDTATDQSKLVSYTDSSSKEEEDFHVDFNFDERTDVAIN